MGGRRWPETAAIASLQNQHGLRRKVRSSPASGSAAREEISRVEPHGRMTRNAAPGQAGCRSATRNSANAGPEWVAGMLGCSRHLRCQVMKV